MRIKNLSMAALVLAGGLAAGALTAKLFSPLNEARLAYAAAHCMGWQPHGVSLEMPVPPAGTPAQSYRIVKLTSWGYCTGEWTRELRTPRQFPSDTPMTVFSGDRDASYVLIKTSERSGLHTYMGMIAFAEREVRPEKANYEGCWPVHNRMTCKR